MANERYAAYDGREAERVLQPAEAGAVVVAKRRQQWFPFFWVERLGNLVVAAVLRLVSFLRRYGFAGAVVCFKAARYLMRRLGGSLQTGFQALSSDVRGIRRDLSMLRTGARLNEQNRGKALRRAYRTYLRRSLRERKPFWQGLRNALLPALTVLILAVSAARFHAAPPALEVRLHDSVVGYAADENVVRRAMDALREILPQGTAPADALGGTPAYRVKRVPLAALSGSAELCESLLAKVRTPLVHACGIYIDGAFLCAVRNESDAVAAFADLIAPVREKAAKGRTVAFVEEITYAQGLYPDDAAILWDPVQLKRTLRTPKSEARRYTVRAGDTILKISKKEKTDVAALRALNPGVDTEHLTAGQKLLTAAQTDYVHIKELEYYTYGGTVPFETVRRESESLRAGTTKLLQQGENGRQVTTAVITYLNGRQIGTAVVSVQQTKAPVQQILLVGTGSPYQSFGEAGAVNSRSGFLWPAVGAYALSSGYGYRSARISGRSFHGGVDIVKPGGHSTGAPVIAAAAGRVTEAHSGYRGYGHTVVIDHGNGLSTRYAHMQPGSITVRAGQKVAQGQQIGRIGSTGNVTGPHLHFEVMKNGVKVNPMNYIG